MVFVMKGFSVFETIPENSDALQVQLLRKAGPMYFIQFNDLDVVLTLFCN